ncbi:hypothetical protein [Vibrio ezurae]|uniref:Lipoprotein n=1 Tax=Vibrio ezurae NBRC 102218 TaxID=1219080 RepID=U3CQ35_9VIBR|nr:hypothetical protein [Vibrio ezurae]GAD80298.1 hypothetical protein VEZ01S_32_00140 [Vibrio ezurae NBRC 102218]
MKNIAFILVLASLLTACDSSDSSTKTLSLNKDTPKARVILKEQTVPMSELTSATKVIPMIGLELATKTVPMANLVSAIKTVSMTELTPATKTIDMTELTPATKTIDMTDLKPAIEAVPMIDLSPSTQTVTMSNLTPAKSVILKSPIQDYPIPEQVKEIYANSNKFAILKHDGSVVTIDVDNNNQPRISTILDENAIAVYPSEHAFVILTKDGSVYSKGFGYVGYPSFSEYSGWSSTDHTNAIRVHNAVSVSTHGDNVAVLKRDGSIKVWGHQWETTGRNITGTYKSVDIGDASVALSKSGSIALLNREYHDQWINFDTSINQNIVASGDNGLLFLEDDGSVFRVYRAANRLPEFQTIVDSGAVAIKSNPLGVVAILRSNGSVVTFGDIDQFGGKLHVRGLNYGGDSSGVSEQLKSGVRTLYCTSTAFAALKVNGSVVTWGKDGGDSSSVSNSLASGVVSIYSTAFAFAALKNDGSVVTWGASKAGGDSSLVEDMLKADVQAIYSNSYAFAALKKDGSVVTWGSKVSGGNSISVQSQLHDVISITPLDSGTQGAFAAIRADGTVVIWGQNQNQKVFSSPMTKAYAPDPNKDTDGDGLTDDFEMSFCDYSVVGNVQPCLDPGKWDTDGDGVSDGKEYNLGQNPLNKDSNLMNASQSLTHLSDGYDGIQDIDQDGYPDGWRLK